MLIHVEYNGLPLSDPAMQPGHETGVHTASPPGIFSCTHTSTVTDCHSGGSINTKIKDLNQANFSLYERIDVHPE